MSKELKECPFCGSSGDEVAMHKEVDGCEWFVRCYVCHVETVRNETDAEAIAAWNRRAPVEQAPDGFAIVPLEPGKGLLMSMALRYDHALGCPGYYDQEPFGKPLGGISHQKRLESTICTMRQLHEEVVGTGFYSPEREEYYRAMIAAAPSAPGREV